jgi:hypothetical protein
MKASFASALLFLATLAGVGACVTPSAESLPALTITVPDLVENGNFVPFLITSSRALVSGEELVLKADSEVVYKVQTTGKISVYAYSGRARMQHSGILHATVTTRSGAKAAVSTTVTVAQGATIPASGVTGNSNKTRVQGDELLVLFINDMPQKGFIEAATIQLRDGDIKVTGTPLLAEKPQLGFRTRNSLKQVEVNAVVKPAS